MPQRQLRLGDILDDYCPRERRITNHAVVAMVGPDVKQTRCTTCDADHEYKSAKVPRQRRKQNTPAALYSQVLANGPKRVAHDPLADDGEGADVADASSDAAENPAPAETATPQAIDAKPDVPASAPVENDDESEAPETDLEEGPVHRPLIRATLPRPEGQPPPTRPAPDFTIRHPGGRPNRFRHRPGGPGRGGQFQGNRSNGNMGGGIPRGSGRPPHGPSSRLARRHGPKRQK